jgi:hypothetical protein
VKTLLLALALILLPTLALAQWSDNFDAYPAGGLIGNGGWEGWNLDPAFDATVSPAFSLSAPHSVEIRSTTDVVNHMGAPQTSGQWTFTGWSYVPGNSVGDQYLIMLNEYVPNGAQNWSVQILLSSDLGAVFDINTAGTSLPLIRDRWVKFEVAIDLDLDIQVVLYNNQVLYSDTWTGHMAPAGIAEIGVVDLFSDGGSSVYWDDLSLEDVTATAVEPASWGQIKSTFR